MDLTPASCQTTPPAAPYTSPSNPDYATYQSLPYIPYTTPVPPLPGQPNPTYAWSIAQPNQNQFTLNPNNPLKQGANASQVAMNNQAKTIFNYTNNTAIPRHLMSPGAVPLQFKSDYDRMQYMQGARAQRIGFACNYTPSPY
jgi:hypothetical protein